MSDLIKTKIIATVGPASNSEDMIRELIKAGADVFRVNSSHGTPEFHQNNIQTIRRVAQELNNPVAILLDLQGPKIRVGNLKEPMQLEKDQTVTLKPCMETDEEGVIPIDYPGILNDVKKGSRVLLNDGKIGLNIVSVDKEKATAKVVYGDVLTSRKGLNIPGSTASLSAVTERDVDYIKFAVELKLDYLALSFVRARADIVKAKDYVKKFGGDIPVIAKIEKPEALDNLSAIINASDGVMVARGDLGIEISPEKVPIVQKKIIEEANAQRKSVITATQMLESMIEEPIPTRAEASDVANAIIDGTDAVMLSAETAAGKYPVEAVTMMNMIAQNVEESNLYNSNQYKTKPKEIYALDSQAIGSAAIRMLDEIEVAAIVAFTKSGFTAKMLSKAKPSVPVIAICEDEEVCRRLNLFWGVFPHLMDFEQHFTESFLKKIDKMLVKQTFIKTGDKIIITGGLPCPGAVKTNFVYIHNVGSAGTIY